MVTWTLRRAPRSGQARGGWRIDDGLVLKRIPVRHFAPVDQVESPQRTQRFTEKNIFSIEDPGFTRRHLASVGMASRTFSVNLCVLCVLCGESSYLPTERMSRFRHQAANGVRHDPDAPVRKNAVRKQ
jgi:hypothetical protein